MNMHDVVPLRKASRSKAVGPREKEFAEVVTMSDNYHSMLDKLGLQPGTDNNVQKTLIAKIDALRVEEFKQSSQLPARMLYTRHPEKEYRNGNYTHDLVRKIDPLTKLASSPTAMVDDIKGVADKLGLVMFAFDFINPKSYSNEGYQLERSIKSFAEVTKSVGLDCYVVAPMFHYQLEKHVRSNRPEMQIYAGANQMIFQSVVMNIPMFRTILNELADIRDQIQAVKSQVSSVTSNMQLMQNQIIQLQKQVEQVVRRQAEQELKMRQAEMAAAEATRRTKLLESDFYAYEPMMIAVPRGTNIITDNPVAKIGPCWGPDFDNGIADLLGVTIIPKQRATLETSLKQLFD